MIELIFSIFLACVFGALVASFVALDRTRKLSELVTKTRGTSEALYGAVTLQNSCLQRMCKTDKAIQDSILAINETLSSKPSYAEVGKIARDEFKRVMN